MLRVMSIILAILPFSAVFAASEFRGQDYIVTRDAQAGDTKGSRPFRAVHADGIKYRYQIARGKNPARGAKRKPKAEKIEDNEGLGPASSFAIGTALLMVMAASGWFVVKRLKKSPQFATIETKVPREIIAKPLDIRPSGVDPATRNIPTDPRTQHLEAS